jgi:membrane-bound metal-dependent hydrolase YbcI (DUF457 family)
MKGTSHVRGGVAAWVALAPLLDVHAAQVVLCIPLVATAALAPDLDHSKATASRWVERKLGRAGKLLVFVITTKTRHRYETHSIFMGAMVAAPLLFLSLFAPGWGQATALAVATGWWMGHIFLDWCTVQGVCLFWPFEWKLRRAPWAFMVRTNQISEVVMLVLLGLIWVGFMLWRYGG